MLILWGQFLPILIALTKGLTPDGKRRENARKIVEDKIGDLNFVENHIALRAAHVLGELGNASDLDRLYKGKPGTKYRAFFVEKPKWFGEELKSKGSYPPEADSVSSPGASAEV